MSASRQRRPNMEANAATCSTAAVISSVECAVDDTSESTERVSSLTIQQRAAVSTSEGLSDEIRDTLDICESVQQDATRCNVEVASSIASSVASVTAQDQASASMSDTAVMYEMLMMQTDEKNAGCISVSKTNTLFDACPSPASPGVFEGDLEHGPSAIGVSSNRVDWTCSHGDVEREMVLSEDMMVQEEHTPKLTSVVGGMLVASVGEDGVRASSSDAGLS
ncbi:hypothetical protein JVU11DRAFT_10894 [Chiua virens]|nr:hypothetical protein JVU11DRAFT_10894 [Chiua virens]